MLVVVYVQCRYCEVYIIRRHRCVSFKRFVAMTHEVIIIVGVLALLVCLSSSDYARLSFKLTRFDDDKFKNPTAAACDWQPKHQKFCKDTNSRCDGNCCQCTCDYQTSTFDSSDMKCQTNDEFRKGCNVKFDGKYAGGQIKPLNLAKTGEAKIYWPVKEWNDVVTSFNIVNIAFYHNGSEVQNKFLTKKGNPRKRGDGNWEIIVKWDPASKDYHGQLFKVDISYTIERSLTGGGSQLVHKSDCFVFKSLGSMAVTFPSPTMSTTLPPSTTEDSTPTSTTLSSTSTPNPKPSTSNTPSSKSATLFSNTTPSQPDTPTTPTSTERPPMTTQESKKTRKPGEPIDKTAEPSRTEPTVAARNEDSGGGGGNNAMTVSLAVVGFLLLLGVVILVVVWSRRRSARASQGKEKGAVDANGCAENPVKMSQVEGIYAEADNHVNYPNKGTNNIVYDNAGVNEEYTSLDMTKVEGKPIYQSLINEQENVYEQIPANYENISSGSPGLIGGAPIKESFSDAADEQAQGPSQIYDLPEETGNGTTRKIPGRIQYENLEGVQIKQADKTAPEKYDREIPRKTGDDNPKRVFNEIENGNPELDYLIILPAALNYEQPVNESVPDA